MTSTAEARSALSKQLRRSQVVLPSPIGEHAVHQGSDAAAAVKVQAAVGVLLRGNDSRRPSDIGSCPRSVADHQVQPPPPASGCHDNTTRNNINSQMVLVHSYDNPPAFSMLTRGNCKRHAMFCVPSSFFKMPSSAWARLSVSRRTHSGEVIWYRRAGLVARCLQVVQTSSQHAQTQPHSSGLTSVAHVFVDGSTASQPSA